MDLGRVRESNRRWLAGIFVLLLFLLPLASTSASVAVDESVIPPRVLFVRGDDAAGAERFWALLEESGYPTTVAAVSEVEGADPSIYDLIIVASDTGYEYTWGGVAALEAIDGAGIPILALGFGGASLLQQLGSPLNWANGAVGETTGVRAVVADHPVFTTPRLVTTGDDGVSVLYESSADVGVTVAPGPGLELLGAEAWSPERFVLARDGLRFLWGFTGTPAEMTSNGHTLFTNVVAYLIGLRRAGEPDLVITDLWAEAGRFHYQVRNVGAALAPAGHETALTIDGVRVAVDPVDQDLGPGDDITRSFDYLNVIVPGGGGDGSEVAPPPAGEQLVQVRADHLEVVIESDEGNNALEETLALDTIPPSFTAGPVVTDVAGTSASVSWSTDELSWGRVSYGTASRGGGEVTEDATPALAHTVVISGLEPGATYRVDVVAGDSAGNEAAAREILFTTVPRMDTVHPEAALNALEAAEGYLVVSGAFTDDAAVDRVDYELDGRRILTDYSATPGLLLATADLVAGEHLLRATAFDAAGNDSSASMATDVVHAPDPGAPQLQLTSPVADATLSGTVTVAALAKAAGGLREAVLTVDAWTKGSKSWLEPRPTEAVVALALDTRQLTNGKHRIALTLYDKGWHTTVAFVDVSVYNAPPDPPPKLEVVHHQVIDRGSYLTVGLTVKNVGGSAATGVVVRDNLILFQAVGQNSPLADYRSELGPHGKGSDAVIEALTDIPAGDTRTFGFNAVPVLQYPATATPMVGNFVDLRWQSTGGASFSDWVQVPATVAGGGTVAGVYAQAVKTADYLLVTSPPNLLHFNPPAEVDDMLSAMAELATLRNGVLGFLDLPSSYPRSLDANSALAVGNVAFDAADDIVIGDAATGRIYTVLTTSRVLAGGIGTQYSTHWSEEGWDEKKVQPPGADGKGFQAGDRLAVGDVRTGGLAEIAMTDSSSGRLLVYGFDGTLHLNVPAAVSAYDGLGVGDVLGDAQEEIVLGSSSTDRVLIFSGSGALLGSFARTLDPDDELAVGDVVAGGKDEIVVGDLSADRIYTYASSGTPLDSFALPFQKGDSLAAGNVAVSGGADAEEIVVSDASMDLVRVFRADGTGPPAIRRPVGEYDPIAVGALVADPREAIVLGDTGADSLDLHFLGQASTDRRLLAGLVKAGPAETGPFGGFLSFFTTLDPDTRPLQPEGEWSRLLHDNYVSHGYLAIVGETEIVPAFPGEKVGRVLTNQGWRDLRADVTDLPYANTYGDENKPELNLGRVIGNSASELAAALRSSIGVARGLPYHEFDRSHSLAVSGYARTLGGGADNINFKSEAVAVTKTGGAWTHLHTPDYTVSTPTYVDVDATRNLIRNRFFSALPGNDVIFLTGHGNLGTWDELNWADVATRGAIFGATTPVVFASSCETGAYFAPKSLANAFVNRGAAVYLGATKWGLGTHSSISKVLFEEWDAGEPLGLAVKQVKRRIADTQLATGSAFPNAYNRYWSQIYHVLGDPKFGADNVAGVVSALSQDADAAVVSDPPAVVSVDVPDYELDRVDGNDIVSIPGNEALSIPGYAEVPTYRVAYEFPKGFQVRDVKLVSRSAPLTLSDLRLPIASVAIGAFGDMADTPAGLAASPADESAGRGWWPVGTHSWNVVEGLDSDVLEIFVYPMEYNAATGDARFYQHLDFQVDSAPATAVIHWLSTGGESFLPGQPVPLEVQMDAGGAGDYALGLAVEDAGTGVLQSGLPLRLLRDLRGAAVYRTVWDPETAPPGRYRVRAELRSADGALVDVAVREVELSGAEVRILDLTASLAGAGGETTVASDLVFENAGPVPVSGVAVVRVLGADGQTLAEYGEEFAELAAGAALTVMGSAVLPDSVPDRVVGQVVYEGASTPPAVVFLWNSPPQADAGSDVLLERNDPGGGRLTLDGSGSSDPDGDALLYRWTWPGGSAEGVAPEVVLPLGTTTVTLSVSDGRRTDEATVEVTVVDTTPPGVDIVFPGEGQAFQGRLTIAVAASDLSAVETVELTLRAHTAGGDTPIGYEGVPAALTSGTNSDGIWTYQLDTTGLPDGFYRLSARAVDSLGNEATSAVRALSVRNWAVVELLPASESNKAGRTMPVKFSLRVTTDIDPAGPFVYNEGLEIRVVDVAAPETILQAARFGEGATAYRIDVSSELYITNFKTGHKPATYHVQVVKLTDGFVVGGFSFTTDR